MASKFSNFTAKKYKVCDKTRQFFFTSTKGVYQQNPSPFTRGFTLQNLPVITRERKKNEHIKNKKLGKKRIMIDIQTRILFI